LYLSIYSIKTTMLTFFQLVNDFVYLYPLLMSFVWVIGSLIFYWRLERGVNDISTIKEFPFFSILVPCHDEEAQIHNTVVQLLELDYPKYEIIVIDDGSTDTTASIIHELSEKHEQVRAAYLKENQGKAAALNIGCLIARADLILTIDADALLDPKALKWIAWHFIKFPRAGAVTGNPRVLNRTTLLAKIQTGEYSTIIGLIKRTQRILGKVLTVSGVIAAFRRQALVSVGFLDTDMVTEDIDITWKLEKRFWDVRYEPRAICWILVPETLKGLWRQRLRWSQGGVEVLRKHIDIWKDWRQRRLWPVGSQKAYRYMERLEAAQIMAGVRGICVQRSLGIHFLDTCYPLGPNRNFYPYLADTACTSHTSSMDWVDSCPYVCNPVCGQPICGPYL